MIAGFLESLPHMLPLALLSRSLGTGDAHLVAGSVMGFLLSLLAARAVYSRFSHVSAYGPTVIGGMGIGYMLFVRMVASFALLFISGPVGALGLAAVMSLAALPLDLLSAVRLRRSFRVGLAALVLMLNVPITGVYPVHLALVGASLLAGRGEAVARKGILMGRGLYALFIGPMEVQSRHGDVISVRRDEEQLIRLGSYPILWSPEGENNELNAHVVITGKSGAGKSTLVYRLLVELLERGHGVTVIDMTGQYALFARWLVGALARPPLREVAENGRVRFVPDRELSERYQTELERVLGRPLQRRPVKEGSGDLRAALARKFVVLNVVERGINAFSPVAGEPYLVMAEDLSYAISVVERTSLGANQHYYLVAAAQEECERALREGRTPRISGVAEVLDDLMSSLDPRERDTFQAIRSLQRRLDLLALYLEPNGVPIAPSEMEAKTSEKEWGQLVVLDLSAIHDEDTKAIAAELILRKVTHYIESGRRPMAPTDRKWFIVVDEAWRLLRPSEDSKHRTKLEWLYRVGRNWNVGVVALTQLWSDLGKIASNADLQVHLSIADADTVEQLVEYTGLQTLRKLGPQLPRHAALILNRSTQDDLERLAAATLYQGRAKVWVVAEMQRLYLPKGQVALVQAELRRERERAAARLQELSARIVSRARAVASVSQGRSSAEVDEGEGGVPRASGTPEPREGPAEGLLEDPLSDLMGELKRRYGVGCRREEVIAACLLLSQGALKGEWLELSWADPRLLRVLEALGVYDPRQGRASLAFEKRVRRLASLGMERQLLSVARRACPACLAYPVTGSHACSSRVSGGGKRGR
ncbi:MAG: DUF87 domain-containing protein [Nitrososphaerota archaeon]